MTCSTYPACNIQFLAYNIIPQLIHRLQIITIVLQGRNIRHSCIHITGPYSMSYRFVLLSDRQMVLPISSATELVLTVPVISFIFASGIQKKFRQIQIACIPCRSVQFDQSQLHLLMSGSHSYFPWFRTKSFTQQISIFNGNIKERTFSRSFIMSYSSLIHMTHIIQLMTVITLILPTVFRSPRMQRITNRTVSIQITVRLLSFPYQVNQAIHISIQFGIFPLLP